MRHLILLMLLPAVVLLVPACTVTETEPEPKAPAPTPSRSADAPAPAPTGHPEIEKEFEYVPCSKCHKSVTPKIFKEWYGSTHGIANVKCYQCHGTYENLRKVPEVSTCGFCHTGHVDSRVKQTTCWECHPAHRFRGHVAKEAK